LYLAPLAEFKLFNGLNIKMMDENIAIPEKLIELKFSGLFLNNFNIMLIVIFLVVLAGFIIYIVSQKCAVN
jgi:hypothetical protein